MIQLQLFYERNWFDHIAGYYIYDKLSEILFNSKLQIKLGDYQNSELSISQYSKYIEFSWSGIYNLEEQVDITIISYLKEGYKYFTGFSYINKDGDEFNYSFDDLKRR